MADDKIGSLEWLRENAKFGCRSCSEYRTLRAKDLRVVAGSELTCENCWDEDLPAFDNDREKTLQLEWPDLDKFDPFAKFEEALTLLREVAEHQWVSIDARGRPMDVTLSDDLIRRIVKAANPEGGK